MSGEIPAELASISSLVILRLDSNQLSGEIPTELGNLSEMTWLDLGDNHLTGAIPPELDNIPNLRSLFLRNNLFTGCIPAALRSVMYNDLDELGLPFCGIPTITVSADSSNYQVRLNSPITLKAMFSEPVVGFTVDDISVASGDVSNFIGDDGDTAYTFDVTPNSIGVVTVDIAADVTMDADGNGNTAATQLSLGLPYDDDRDGTIGLAEAIEAVRDYFDGNLRLDHAIAVVSLYFASL